MFHTPCQCLMRHEPCRSRTIDKVQLQACPRRCEHSRRSAPVPGRSNVRHLNAVRRIGQPRQFGYCCARGRAHSGGGWSVPLSLALPCRFGLLLLLVIGEEHADISLQYSKWKLSAFNVLPSWPFMADGVCFPLCFWLAALPPPPSIGSNARATASLSWRSPRRDARASLS